MNEVILCLDDEEDLLELLEIQLNNALSGRGYEVVTCLNTDMARRFVEKEHVALIIADRRLLAGEDGLEFIREIQNRGYNIPTIVLSALGSVHEKAQGLEYADDYIAKPHDQEELIARVNALLRRYNQINQRRDVIKYKNITLETNNRALIIDSTNIQLSPLETRIIVCFLENANKILSRDFLIANAWERKIQQENSVNVAIKRLRKKIEKKSKDFTIISIRNEGYRLC